MFSPLFITNYQLDNRFEEAYLNQISALKNLKEFHFKKSVTFFVGENGSGKSTLLEAMAVASEFNPEGGSKNFNFQTADTHSSLYNQIHLTKGFRRPKDSYFLRAESFYNVATEVDRLEAIPTNDGSSVVEAYGGRSLHMQSHGESFLSLILERFFGNGLYILDEPEAALSPSRQMAILTKIHELVEKNSQFIIATHSPILLSYPNAEIVEIKENHVQLITYKECEHYVLTKQFLENPEKMLGYLLEK